MVTGTGTFILSQQDNASGGGMPAPPFAANSAVNGLSVNGAGQIVFGDDLGGGLADLLNDREIEMSGNLFRFINGGTPVLLLDNANNFYGLGDPATFSVPTFYSVTSGATKSAAIISGDLGLGQYGAHSLNYDIATGEPLVQTSAINATDSSVITLQPNLFDVEFNSDPYLILDNANDRWGIGDVNNYIKPVILAEITGAGAPITTQYVQNNAGTLTAYQELAISNAATEPRFIVELTGTGMDSDLRLTEDLFQVRFDAGGTFDPYLILDNANGKWGIGDLANYIEPVFEIFKASTDDKGFSFYAEDAANARVAQLSMGVIPATGSYITASFNDPVNNVAFDFDNQGIEFIRNADNVFLVDFANDIYSFGDRSGGILNGSHIEINDAANVLNIKNTANTLGININGVAGFTGTVAAPATITVNNGIVTNVA